MRPTRTGREYACTANEPGVVGASWSGTVTVTLVAGPTFPAASLARTAYVCFCVAATAVSVQPVPVTVATTAPSRSTSYEATPTSSVAAAHVRLTVGGASCAAAVTEAGAVGGARSPVVALAVVAALRLPAASSATTEYA